MHDRKLTVCVDASEPDMPETSLEETARLEQSPAVHETAVEGDRVANAVVPAHLSSTRGTAPDPSDPDTGPEHSSPGTPAEICHTVGDGLADAAVSETAVPTDGPSGGENEPEALPAYPADDPFAVPAEPEIQLPPPDAARADAALPETSVPTDSPIDAEFEPETSPSRADDSPRAPLAETQPRPKSPPSIATAAHAAVAETGSPERSVDEPRAPPASARSDGEISADAIASPAGIHSIGSPIETRQPCWSTADFADLGRASNRSAPAPELSARPEIALDQEDGSRNAVWWLERAGRYLMTGLGIWFAAMVLLIAIFRFVNPPASALMLIRAAQGVDIDQRWVPLEEISPNLVRAVIASEDGRFCRHWGIDPREVLDAIRRSNGGTPRGASTMTMQLAKNLFLWPQQSYLRKALEVPLTLTIDAFWPKSRIAEVYLNIVEWGPGIFGAEAAARRHFDRSAEKLSRRQSALLAVSLPNPLVRKPAAPSRLLRRMASTIEARVRNMSTADDCVTKAR